MTVCGVHRSAAGFNPYGIGGMYLVLVCCGLPRRIARARVAISALLCCGRLCDRGFCNETQAFACTMQLVQVIVATSRSVRSDAGLDVRERLHLFRSRRGPFLIHYFFRDYHAAPQGLCMCVIIGIMCGRALARAIPCLVTRLSTLEAKTFGCRALFCQVSGFSATVALQCFRIRSMFLKELPFSASARENAWRSSSGTWSRPTKCCPMKNPPRGVPVVLLMGPRRVYRLPTLLRPFRLRSWKRPFAARYFLSAVRAVQNASERY